MSVICAICKTEFDNDENLCPKCGIVVAVSIMPSRESRVRRQTAALDEHGQPLNPFFNQQRRTDRDISELLGVAKGLLADGIVNEQEAFFLRDWGSNHPDAVLQWPVSLIFTRLKQFFADGQVDELERLELRELLSSLIGGKITTVLGCEGATQLPLDRPVPTIAWGPAHIYVFTGKFAYGTREQCEREVLSRQSLCEKNVTKRTSFLVLGTFGSEDWAHTSYGRKIERAVELKKVGTPIRIIGEDHWASSLS